MRRMRNPYNIPIYHPTPYKGNVILLSLGNNTLIKKGRNFALRFAFLTIELQAKFLLSWTTVRGPLKTEVVEP